MTSPTDPTTPRRTLAEYLDLYPYDSAPHPWVHRVKAIPMGFNGEVPMNHSLQVLNLMAIHMERVGFKLHDDAIEIKYVPPLHGPNVVYNPGTWVDIDVEVPEVDDVPEISLEGVPTAQIEMLERAIEAEKIRKIKIASADTLAREDAEGAEIIQNIVPVTEGE